MKHRIHRYYLRKGSEMKIDWLSAIPFFLLTFLFMGIEMIVHTDIRVWTLKHRAELRLHFFKTMRGYSGLTQMVQRKRNGPIYFIIQKIYAYRQERMRKEIFESLAFLRNMASIEQGKISRSDTIIEQLSEYEGLLKPVYIKMLHYIRMNQIPQAIQYFSQAVGTQAGKDFAVLLMRWDQLEPQELMETLLSYESSMKAIRITEQKKKDEIISELIYFPVVINILIIFINFIYIAYFLDQKELMQMFL